MPYYTQNTPTSLFPFIFCPSNQIHGYHFFLKLISTHVSNTFYPLLPTPSSFLVFQTQLLLFSKFISSAKYAHPKPAPSHPNPHWPSTLPRRTNTNPRPWRTRYACSSSPFPCRRSPSLPAAAAAAAACPAVKACRSHRSTPGRSCRSSPTRECPAHEDSKPASGRRTRGPT